MRLSPPQPVVRLLLVLVLAALTPALTPAPTHAARWWRASTPHFAFYSTAEPESVLRVARGLERMAETVERSGIGSRQRERVRTDLISFDDKRTWQDMLPLRSDGKRLEAAGLAYRTPYGNTIIFAGYDPRGRQVAHHEYTHTIVSAALQRAPVCLNEGLAELFSTWVSLADGSYYGHSLRWHEWVLASSRPWPLADVFATGPGSRAYEAGDDRAMLYAESWALVHYLARNSGGLRKFMDFAKLYDQGRSAPEAFAAVYPSEDWNGLHEHLLDYLRSDQFSVSFIGESQPLDSVRVELREAPQAEMQARIACLFGWRAGPDSTAARERAAAALAADSTLALAHVALGQLASRLGRTDEAAREYRAAARAPEARTLALAGAGMMLASFRGDSTRRVPGVREALAILERSLDADSTDAMALAFYGKGHELIGEPTERSSAALRKAIRALPAEPWLLQSPGSNDFVPRPRAPLDEGRWAPAGHRVQREPCRGAGRLVAGPAAARSGLSPVRPSPR